MANIILPSECSWTEALSLFGKSFADNKGLRYFCKLKTNYDRIEFISLQPDVKKFLLNWLSSARKENKKSALVSNELRKNGNVFFQKKINNLALKYYTQSIFFAPEDDEALPVAFANRSAVLFHMKKFKECISDIDWAFKYDYPKKLYYKLYHRKGQALIKLRQFAEAKEYLKKSQSFMEYADIPASRKGELEKDIDSMLSSITEPINSQLELTEDRKIPTLEKQNPNIPYASAAVHMNYEENRGRYILANEYIKEGTTLFFEKPFAFVVLPEFKYSHCHHCCSSSFALIPCKHCCEVGFCSDSCQNEAWTKYHQYECQNTDILNIIGIAHLSLRLLFAAGILNLIQLKDSLDKMKHSSGIPGLNNEGKFEDSYYSVYHLVAHTEKLNQSDLLYHALTAFLLLLLFGEKKIDGYKSPQDCSEESVKDLIPKQHRSFIGSLLMRHMQQLICNAHAITDVITPNENEYEKTVTLEQVRIATGIFPSASLLNHSCNPNIISSFYKSWLILRSTKCIPSGSEVFNCYGPHYKRMTVEDRKATLLQQYFFHCLCEACLRDRRANSKDMELFCKGCGESIFVLLNEKCTSLKCNSCGITNDFADDADKYWTAKLLYDKASMNIECRHYDDAIKNLKSCLKIRKEILPTIHKDLAVTQDKLAFVYSQKGDFFGAYEMLKESLASVKIRYGSESIEVAHELRKFSDVIINLLLNSGQLVKMKNPKLTFGSLLSEAMETVDGARKIFSLFYGDWHEDTREMVDSLKQLRDMERSERGERPAC